MLKPKLRRDRITVWEFPLWIVLAIFTGYFALIPLAFRLFFIIKERRGIT